MATGHAGPLVVAAGQRQTSSVKLACDGLPCVTPGTLDPDGGVPVPRCGNGRIDMGEECDTAIPPGAPGACPPSDCDDRVPCTTDVHKGDGCNAACAHTEIVAPIAGDGCCPAKATNATDADCSADCGNGIVDPGETCDTDIPGGGPGACPTIADCADGDRCASDSPGLRGDLRGDLRALPRVPSERRSGGWVLSPGWQQRRRHRLPSRLRQRYRGEVARFCDVAIIPPASGHCPAVCDDGFPETTDFAKGSGCMAECMSVPIEAPVSGDGYCFPGANHSTDSDCQPSCSNTIIEPGEACESEAIGDASCPTSCSPLPSACLLVNLVGTALTCSSRCEVKTRTNCSLTAPDQCCPAGCTALTDADCSPSCGDGVVQTAARETCDIAIPSRQARCLSDGLRRREPLHRGAPAQRRHLRGDLRVRSDPRLPARGRLLPVGGRLQRRSRLCPALRQRRRGEPRRTMRRRGRHWILPSRLPIQRRLHTARPPRGYRHLQRDVRPAADHHLRGRRRLLPGRLHQSR